MPFASGELLLVQGSEDIIQTIYGEYEAHAKDEAVAISLKTSVGGAPGVVQWLDKTTHAARRDLGLWLDIDGTLEALEPKPPVIALQVQRIWAVGRPPTPHRPATAV